MVHLTGTCRIPQEHPLSFQRNYYGHTFLQHLGLFPASSDLISYPRFLNHLKWLLFLLSQTIM